MTNVLYFIGIIFSLYILLLRISECFESFYKHFPVETYSAGLGVAIGILNTAGYLNGVAIGLLNYAGNRQSGFKLLPVVNWHFE